MIYLTVNDAPSGVYKSQVIDVIEYINKTTSSSIKLIAFISIRGFNKNKLTIQNWYKNSIVIPMIPGITRWYQNKLILKLRFPNIKSEVCIARNAMAYAIADSHFKTVIYDGRGAIGAELEEYPSMIPIPEVVKNIKTWERRAVLYAKFRIAVSEKLVNYWNKEFGYSESDHLVIPCTVSKSLSSQEKTELELLKELSWKSSDVILIYSGGVAGWQSFNKLSSIIPIWIEEHCVKILFLTKNCPEIETLTSQYPQDIKRLWLKPEEVQTYLKIGDYGILIRNKNITNSVASPVKFAEYLNAGLNLILSENIGDFSEFVANKKCGHILSDNNDDNKINFIKSDQEVKSFNKKLALSHFSKEAYKESYKVLSKI